MADTVKIKSGALGGRETMPRLEENELGYRTDEKSLYIGSANGNERLCGVDDINAIMAEINSIKIAISEINARLETPSQEERSG